MSGLVKKIIQLCEKQYFLKPVAVDSGDAISCYYKHGPTGELLRNNIYEEWFLSNVINTEASMFPYSDIGDIATSIEAIGESFAHAKELLCQKLPFGICGSREECISDEEDSLLVGRNSSQESSYFHPAKYTALRTYFFLHPENSYRKFNSWQQNRKHWWRKFSGSPGRYTLTDVKHSPQGEQVIIKAEFSWGSEVLETITLHGARPLEQLDNGSRTLFEVNKTYLLLSLELGLKTQT